MLTRRKKRKYNTRRKPRVRYLDDREDIELATPGAPLSYKSHEVCEELPESYVPELGVMLNEPMTLDSLPREGPPVVIRVEKQSRRKGEVDMKDWDVLSICSNESFCVV